MLILYYCCASLVSEVLSHLLLWQHTINMPIINLFIIIEFFLLTYFYKRLFTNTSIDILHKALWGIASFIILMEMITRDFHQYYSFFSLFSNLVLVLYAVFFFRSILIQQPVDIITDYYLFWFNSACFVYFSCTSIIFCLQNLPGSYINTHQIIIFTHILFNYIFYLLLTIGLCKTVQK